MKNIYVLPTDKASRLLYNSTLKSFCIQKEIDGMFINDGKVSGANFWGLEKALNNGFQPHNIYITSYNADINQNDYIITKDGRLVEVSYLLSKDLEGASKIILTTDVDLIKDGVQAIDDKFLEWFVKNSSCESVEVETVKFCLEKASISLHQIITPKEEPKQETFEEVAKKYSGSKKAKKIFSKKDMQSFIKIRNYFGENDKTSIEHFAYSFLNGVIEQFKNK